MGPLGLLFWDFFRLFLKWDMLPSLSTNSQPLFGIVPGRAAPKTMLVHRFMGLMGAVHMEWKGGSKATLPLFALPSKKMGARHDFCYCPDQYYPKRGWELVLRAAICWFHI
jgi:hypothetical protein